MVNPLSSDLSPSLVLKVTTLFTLPPSMIVTLAPPELFTLMDLPMKLMFSKYVPEATSTVSPFLAALIPAWIVGWFAGTLIVAATLKAVVNTSRHRVDKCFMRDLDEMGAWGGKRV